MTVEEFNEFCREGRLAGTKGNRKAVLILKRHLEQAGFVPCETNFAPSGRRLFVIFVCIFVAYFVALAALLRGQALGLLLLAVGPILRGWQAMRKGTPLAVYGVRKDTEMLPGQGKDPAKENGEKARPTVILCAHYDSAFVFFPFSGSPIKGIFSVFGAVVLSGLLSEVVHPIVGVAFLWLVLGSFGLSFLFGNAAVGADDNASGVFAVLECLRRFGHQPGVNIVPVFFNLEEFGLIGSRAWVRRLRRKTEGIQGLKVDQKHAYVINFDCVGRGRRVFISGSRELRERLLATKAAKALEATRTWLYPSDHLVFRSPWKAVSFVRADRFWALDLRWVHSRRDVPTEIRLEYIAEIATIVEEFVQDLAVQYGS